MAFRSSSYWRSVVNQIRSSNAATYATSTPTKLKAYAPTAEFSHHPNQKKQATRGDVVPIYISVGLIVLQVSFGVFTIYHQLVHCPNVRVKKKDRETVPEVADPDKVANESEQFLKKSWFRKVAHVQEFHNGLAYLPHTIHKDAYAHGGHMESLKDVGIDPKQVL